MQGENDKKRGRKRHRSQNDSGSGDQDRHRSKAPRRERSENSSGTARAVARTGLNTTPRAPEDFGQGRPDARPMKEPRSSPSVGARPSAGADPTRRISRDRISSDLIRRDSTANKIEDAMPIDPRQTIWQYMTEVLDILTNLGAPADTIRDTINLTNVAYDLVDQGSEIDVPGISPDVGHVAVHKVVSEAVWRMFACHHFRTEYQEELKMELDLFYGQQRAADFERRCDDAFALWAQDGSRKPETTAFEIFQEVAWEAVTEKFDALNPNLKTKARFIDLRKWSEDDMTRDFVPRLAVPLSSAGGYCELLLHDIRKYRNRELQNIRGEWAQAISDAEGRQDELERRQLEGELNTMERAVRGGEIPYGPREQRLPSWDQKVKKWEGLAQSLGFDQERTFGFPMGLVYVIDRKVVKETYAASLRSGWDDSRLWFGNFLDRVPLEYGLASSVSSKRGGDTILRVDGYGIYDTLAMHRLYAEYCPHGDLEDLIDEYAGLKYSDLVDENGRPYGKYIPNRMLWAIFEALVAALCMMSDGKLPSSRFAVTHQPLFHRDLKPANIFMAKPSTTDWHEIPIAKVGDFGLSIHASDPTSGAQGVGTLGYMAPESYDYPPVSDWYRNTEISAKADLWSVARIMLSLMRLENDNNVDVVTLDDFAPPQLEPELEVHYSQTLIDLVHECLKFWPDDRPTCQEVWKRIQREVNYKDPALEEESLKKRDRQDDEIILYRNPADAYSKMTFQRD
ncbi:hypothetical protein CB0940_07448 [Cercospora beticola]|uniref:non-specific serine/threonine protein kinase n=1 Tax=Cercospora beticola TaxID=122368 RepID=A0A2G5HAP7_CERBT|nr:hypothetical protein CB0940_07448 [Cercospora beticola]PIA89588.1 hypothetical protein CB0940_07448 [Cercospora beticola]WPB03401.1 hypothetical protein RHO25_008040 [Cercospora beticola]